VDAHCGVLISLDSGVATKSQFSIGRSPQQKPVLFLTFQDMDVSLQRELLCWGVRALTEIVEEKERDNMILRIETFLAKISESVKDIDVVIRTQTKGLEDLKTLRGGILRNMREFRGCEEEDEGCVAIVKATGTRCGRKVTEGDRCGNHRPRKSEQIGEKLTE
jgi:hypothetical protein